MKKQIILFISFLFISTLVSGCGLSKKVFGDEEEVLESGIHFYQVKASENEDVASQPSSLEEKFIRTVVALLRYKPLDGTENVFSIFYEKDHETLISQLATNFTSLQAGEKLGFKYVGSMNRITSGETFFDKNGDWNWKFLKINGVSQEGSWELVTAKVFAYKAISTLLDGKVIKHNWIKVNQASLPKNIDDLLKPTQKENNSVVLQKKSREKQLGEIDDINKRLRFLKELYDNNYISEKDYLKQKDRLLNRL